jgi:DNA (cytosine-5)-methyltransferase 1
MLRAIREIQPTWIVGENVRGLTNWNGGLVFDEVQSDLEAQGYEVTPFLLPAASVNAPHRRDRIWFIAYNASYSNLLRFDKCIQYDEVNTGEGRLDAFGDIDKGDVNGYASDSKNKGLEGMRGKKRGYSKLHRRQFRIENWKNFPTVSPICDGNDGLSYRLDSITFPKWRNESIKAGGNAVVPQVVYQIFKAIEKYNELDKQLTI